MASSYTVERSRTIPVAVERVYPLIVDFHQWPRWSPWEDLDPEMHRSYGGPESGTGATYAWSGNRKAGAGTMTITDVAENQRVDIDLTFDKPFKSQNKTTFMLAPEGEQTTVTWTMTGPRPLLMRLMGPLMNMDKLVGKDFEKGLDRMAQVAPMAE